MSDPVLISVTALRRKIFQKSHPAFRRIGAATLICCLLAQGVLADSVTYQQLQQNQASGATASSPAVVRSKDQNQQQNNQGQGQSSQSSQPSQSQAGAAQESPNHPEFVRLPDGRIVRYGPGILCDENCVEPVTPAAFREPGPRLWWIVPPIVAGGILCAILCRPGRDSQPQPTPTIIIPPSPIASPSVSPTASPTPPPDEIPEPGTLVLLSLGIGAMLARRRMAAKKGQN